MVSSVDLASCMLATSFAIQEPHQLDSCICSSSEVDGMHIQLTFPPSARRYACTPTHHNLAHRHIDIAKKPGKDSTQRAANGRGLTNNRLCGKGARTAPCACRAQFSLWELANSKALPREHRWRRARHHRLTRSAGRRKGVLDQVNGAAGVRSQRDAARVWAKGPSQGVSELGRCAALGSLPDCASSGWFSRALR
jgi:hypothetical protein